MEQEKCCMCEFMFKPGTLVDGKCGPCAEKFPDVHSMKEWRDKQDPLAKKNDAEVTRRVEELLTRKLTELGVLADCACGKAFYKRSPAQKRCLSCARHDKQIEETK